MKLALSKGRVLEEALPLLARAGLAPTQDPNHSRKLVLDTEREGFQLVIIRASDVPTFVQFGAADLGIVGKDLLLEHDGGEVYELLDLDIARCRMSVAEPAHSNQFYAANARQASGSRLRIATKYPRITRQHFSAQGIQTEIIKLYGSMELAPLVGLADAIVDLVSSGQTLHDNGLREVETITDISARLVANKASLKMKQPLLGEIINTLQKGLATS